MKLMAVIDFRKQGSVLALLTLVIAALGLLAPPPAAASYYEEGVSFTGQIVRGSVPYRLNVKAVEAMGSAYRLDVSISKLMPAGGSNALRQTQTWSFDLEEGDLSRDGDTYGINAGIRQGPFHVEVIVEPRQDATCSPHQQLFVTQPQGGAFRIETGNGTFGTITELPECGKPWSYATGPDYRRPCPVAGQQLGSFALNVKEPRRGDTARIAVYEARVRNVAGHQVQWSVELRGTLSARRFRLNRDLEGSFRGGGAPWLEGTAVFEPQRPLVREGWYNCTDGLEARSSWRSGAINGDLTVDVIGYESYRVADPNASALRSRVRPRR